jgi:hypothetical protein
MNYLIVCKYLDRIYKVKFVYPGKKLKRNSPKPKYSIRADYDGLYFETYEEANTYLKRRLKKATLQFFGKPITAEDIYIKYMGSDELGEKFKML